jgi:hypothetical protein
MEFLVSIPIRTEDAQNVIDAFISKHPYSAPVPAEVVADNAGNPIPNPITKANYVEDCVAYYILDVTKSYIVRKAALEARATADQDATTVVNELGEWIRQQ